jgi:hypothetical protein
MFGMLLRERQTYQRLWRLQNLVKSRKKDRVIQMRVRRLAAKMYTTPSKPPVPSIITVPAMASLSTLEKTTPSICTQESFDRKGMQTRASSRKRAMSMKVSIATSATYTEQNTVKRRRTCKQKQYDDTMVVMQTNKEREGMKAATSQLVVFRQLPKSDPDRKKMSENSIVESVNKIHQCTLSRQTVQRYVNKGLIGVSPTKRGPLVRIPKEIYNLVKGAFASFLQLEQANGTTQTTMIGMENHIHLCLKKGGIVMDKRTLIRKLRLDTANQFLCYIVQPMYVRRTEKRCVDNVW